MWRFRRPAELASEGGGAGIDDGAPKHRQPAV